MTKNTKKRHNNKVGKINSNIVNFVFPILIFIIIYQFF